MKPTPTYQRNGVRLYLGDCREVMPHLVTQFDAVITDPPFGVDYSSGQGSDVWGDGAIAGDSDTTTRDAALNLIGDCPALVFGSWRRDRPIGTRMLLVWDTLGALGMGDLRLPWKPSHQEIYVLGDPTGFCGHRGSDVIQHPPVQAMAQNGRVHPMQKPVGLICTLLQKMRGDTVLDCFMGSGTTGVACVKTGRKFIGIERERAYFDIAVKRIEKAFEDQALFTGGAA